MGDGKIEQSALLRELDQLSDYEKEHIRLVLLRHEQLEQGQDQKVKALKDELVFLQRGADACADFLDAELSCKLCGAEFRKFIRTDRRSCDSCTRVVCFNCVTHVDKAKKTVLCLICAKGWEIWQISGEWFKPKKDRENAVSVLKMGLDPPHRITKPFLSASTDILNPRTPDADSTKEKAKRQLSRPGSEGDLLFARRSLHINAKYEPRSDRSFLPPMVERIYHFEEKVTVGLRQALFDTSATKNGNTAQKAIQQTKEPKSHQSQPEEEVTVTNTHGRKSVTWQVNRGIDMSPKRPSKRIKEVTPLKVVPFSTPEVPMKETDPQLRLAFNYDDGQLEVYIMRCRNLPVGKSDKHPLPSPYVKGYLVSPNGVRIKRKTSTKKKTCDPEFNEVLRFPVAKEEVTKWTLRLMVCVKRGFLYFMTNILEMTTMVVTEEYMELERPLWVHFHQ